MIFTIFTAITIMNAFIAVTIVSYGNPVVFLMSADPLVAVAVIAASCAVTCFFAGLITGDYSWVDRLWSIIPAVYVWIYALRAWPDARLIVIAVLVTLWGARLTFNFARKGGYSGEEDYRWAEVRKSIPNRMAWEAFNFGFISLYQNLLFLLFTLPAYAAYQYAGEPIGPGDVAAAVLFVLFLIFETLADQQQWNFQNAKKAARLSGEKSAGDIAQGFLTGGLFRYSRHPNFFCEQGIWWAVYLFAFSATDEWLHWSGIGAVLLTLLFHGSTMLTEKISSGKYPEYAAYRNRTSRLIPWFPGGPGTGGRTLKNNE